MAADDPHLRDDDFTPKEQDEWDERSEHERVIDVTGVGPYDLDEGDEGEKREAPDTA
jgi:hypothetical protein